MFQCLKNIEIGTRNLDDNNATIKDDILTAVNNYIKRNKTQHITREDRMINNNLIITKKFKKDNPEIFITKADKGNVTVIMKKTEYIEKVEIALSEKKYYTVINKSPLRILQNKIKVLIKNWEQKGVLDSDTCFSRVSHTDIDNTNLARAYALVKIHKENNPIRIIVSAIGSPTYSFDKSLSILFNKHFPRPKSTIKNSTELKEIVDKITVPDGFELVSFDVVSLFTNIPTDLILHAIEKRWKYLKNKINLSKIEFLEGIKLLLDSTFLQFNNKYYKQIMGAPMGFCTSPWFADIALELLETSCLKNYSEDVLLYKRYVDDCLLIVKKDKIEEILSTFNNYNNNLQFTIERETNNSINFLDIQLIRTNNKIITNWYRKSTASGRYINYHSHHPETQKIAIVYSLVDKAIKLSDAQFHKQNLKIVKHYLSCNNYPQNIINRHISKRLKVIANNTHTKEKTPRSVLLKNKIVLPFIKHLSPKINHILHKHNIIPIYQSVNKFNNLITLGKDCFEKMHISGIVYKINCQDCTSTYIGMSKRKLKTRTTEHIRAVKQCSEKSALATHVEKTGHKIDFNKVNILDIEKNFYKRSFSEMLNIYFHDNTLNCIQDLNFLKNSYKKTIDLIKQFCIT